MYPIAQRLLEVVGADCRQRSRRRVGARRRTHDELLAAGGFYAELYDIQFGEHATALADDARVWQRRVHSCRRCSRCPQRSIRKCSFTLATICGSVSLSAVSISTVHSENVLDRLRRSLSSSLASPGPEIQNSSGCH